jgi:adenylate cyclase
MAEERVRRRLAAILAADVVGYSRLMGLDEIGTLDRLKALRRDLIDPKIDRYGGRLVKTTGDGLLAEFPSAVDAVAYAVDLQSGLAARNADLPEGHRISLRVGINVGDIISDADGDIFGDGVNVAARLEPLAAPGGIAISARVYEHVGGRLDPAFDVAFEDAGEISLKNIAQPVRVYRARFGGASADAVAGDALPAQADPGDRPSIAVLAFDNMSGDPEQAYFADGIAEDIITDLSQVSGLFVIA